MSRPARIRRKDLKRPDEFVTISARALGWARTHQRNLAIAGTALAIAIVGTAVFFAVRQARLRDANVDLGRALVLYRDAAKATDASNQLAEVGRRWSGTSPGDVATLLAGASDLRRDNTDSAVAALQEVGARDWPPYVKQQILLNLGYAFEKKGQGAEAISKYAEASSLDGPYTFDALLAEARVQEATDKTKSRALYERLKRDFPDSPEKDFIEAKLAAN
ncbi:MAG TPA: tetratricopeptide repeat protein [Candidatus Binatia bacterium]|nr:tetratricopeptide repeat protein [Candidatus Binatia bacterium]